MPTGVAIALAPLSKEKAANALPFVAEQRLLRNQQQMPWRDHHQPAEAPAAAAAAAAATEPALALPAPPYGRRIALSTAADGKKAPLAAPPEHAAGEDQQGRPPDEFSFPPPAPSPSKEEEHFTYPDGTDDAVRDRGGKANPRRKRRAQSTTLFVVVVVVALMAVAGAITAVSVRSKAATAGASSESQSDKESPAAADTTTTTTASTAQHPATHDPTTSTITADPPASSSRSPLGTSNPSSSSVLPPTLSAPSSSPSTAAAAADAPSLPPVIPASTPPTATTTTTSTPPPTSPDATSPPPPPPPPDPSSLPREGGSLPPVPAGTAFQIYILASSTCVSISATNVSVGAACETPPPAGGDSAQVFVGGQDAPWVHVATGRCLQVVDFYRGTGVEPCADDSGGASQQQRQRLSLVGGALVDGTGTCAAAPSEDRTEVDDCGEFRLIPPQPAVYTYPSSAATDSKAAQPERWCHDTTHRHLHAPPPTFQLLVGPFTRCVDSKTGRDLLPGKCATPPAANSTQLFRGGQGAAWVHLASGNCLAIMDAWYDPGLVPCADGGGGGNEQQTWTLQGTTLYDGNGECSVDPLAVQTDDLNSILHVWGAA
ncbi:hypothetical protein DFJ73DRAFT_802664 [Zopfochytrium polystomum]|nr:hypothetical protein DFJ73DRAFT_802664 [Zopfochytrium polystomum]